MLSLSDNTQADVVEAFNSTPRYLDGLLNIDRGCTNVVITCIQSLCLYTIKMFNLILIIFIFSKC